MKGTKDVPLRVVPLWHVLYPKGWFILLQDTPLYLHQVTENEVMGKWNSQRSPGAHLHNLSYMPSESEVLWVKRMLISWVHNVSDIAKIRTWPEPELMLKHDIFKTSPKGWEDSACPDAGRKSWGKAMVCIEKNSHNIATCYYHTYASDMLVLAVRWNVIHSSSCFSFSVY